ncbi:hypothetical protein GCM10009675_23050 [Prauserella alba]|uniref:Uncharacterized protein n=1 Tax=Prauserella alba TaxID=176898 RepID=A0ABN1VDJ7_9PSEU
MHAGFVLRFPGLAALAGRAVLRDQVELRVIAPCGRVYHAVLKAHGVVGVRLFRLPACSVGVLFGLVGDKPARR